MGASVRQAEIVFEVPKLKNCGISTSVCACCTEEQLCLYELSGLCSTRTISTIWLRGAKKQKIGKTVPFQVGTDTICLRDAKKQK